MSNLVKGSLGAIAAQNGQSLAQTFLSCDCVVLVDTSGSMGTHDSAEGRTRYGQACLELADLQVALPGKIGVVAFSDRVMFCPNGQPFNFGGGTDLTKALEFAKVADIPGAMRFIVISDGQPDDPSGALKIAKTYQNKIDTIYVGPEGGHGLDFLRQLAAASGGSHVTSAQAKSLAANVQKLLATA